MKFGFSKIVSILSVAAVSSLSISAEAPAGYYNALEGKTGSDLQRAVKSIVRNHKAISYGDNTWQAFRSTDVRTVNGKQCWW